MLHPSGAYYVPMTVSTAQLQARLSATAAPGQQQQGDTVVCHPVNIPVHYTGTADVVVSLNDDQEHHHHHYHHQTAHCQLQQL